MSRRHQGLLAEAIKVADKVGLSVSLENTDGVGGKQPAAVKSDQWVVLDRQQPPRESLMHLVRIIKGHANQLPDMSNELGDVFDEKKRRAA